MSIYMRVYYNIYSIKLIYFSLIDSRRTSIIITTIICERNIAWYALFKVFVEVKPLSNLWNGEGLEGSDLSVGVKSNFCLKQNII